MHIPRKSILLLLLFSSSPLIAQYTFFGFRQGIGLYSMKSLDDLQELRRGESGLPLVTTESYPATLNFHAEIGRYMPYFVSKCGLFYGYVSTGARSTISDYSGRYDLDAVISGHQLGLSLENVFVASNPWGCGTYVEAGAVFTRLKTLDFFNLTYPVHVTYKSAYEFSAFGGYGEAGLFLQYNYRFLMARLNLGYLADFMGGLHLKDNKNAQLYLGNKKIRPQWDGLRFGLQLNFVYRKHEKTN